MFKAAFTSWTGRIALLSLLSIPFCAAAQTNSVTLNWTASTDTNVVGYKVYYGLASRDYTTTVDVGDVTTATIGGLVAGTTYYFAVTAYDSFGLESDYSNEISYTIPMTNGTATVVLTVPANGATYAAPAAVSLAATVTTNGQTISAVQFYNGTTLLGSDSSAPYTLNWPNVAAGTYSLTAVVAYDIGLTTTSAPVNITVTNLPPPTVALTSPSSGSTYASPATIPFTASVTANGNTITSVQYYNGASLVGSATTAPYLFNWSGVGAGTYIVHALVVYAAGSLASASVSVTVTNPPPTVALTSPANGAAFAVPATISLAASVTANGNSITGVQFYNGASLLGTAGTAPYTYTWSNVSTGSYTLTAVALYGSGSAVISSTRTVSVHTPPVITAISNQATIVNTPTAPIPFTVTDVETSSSNLVVSATSDTPALVATSAIVFAGSGSNRSLTITPITNQTGIATIAVTVSYSGVSASTSFELEIATTNGRPPAPSLISVTGIGSVTPNLIASSVVLGQTYTVTAVPGPGQMFSQWTGSITSTNSTISFVYTTNFALTANFVPSPYVVTPGLYSGIFYDTNQVDPASAGHFAFIVTKRATYSGYVQLASRRFLFSGKLDGNGRGTNTFPRRVAAALNLNLDLGAGSLLNQVFGSLSDGTWVASLLGNRAVYNARTNAAPNAGAYTLVLPGQETLPLLPEGNGYGTVRVTPGGVILFAGTLADGLKVSQSARLSSDGQWPLYISLYAGQGLLAGWLDFTNETESDLSGQVSWTRPADAAARYFPAGFTNQFEAVGSAYTPPTGSAEILNLTNATVTFSGGDISTAFTNSVSLGGSDHVTSVSGNPISLKFWPASGLFTGLAQDPSSGGLLPYSGVVFQKLATGYGMSLGANQSSQVFISQ